MADDVETNLYLFYPCKLINNLLKIADMIDFHCLGIALVDEVLGQRPSTAHPVLTVSIPEDTPEPSDQEEEDDDVKCSPPAGSVMYNLGLMFLCFVLPLRWP